MTTKFDVFLYELTRLCEQHKVVLSPDTYDNLQVWNWDGKEPVLQFPDIEDLTPVPVASKPKP